MTRVLNVLWFVLGGWISGLLWLLAAAVLALTLVGLPWSMAAIRLAGFSAAPFGRIVIPRQVGGAPEWFGSGDLEVALNVVWVVLAGWWLALHHLLLAVALFVSLIGIPFGVQHLKLAGLSLAPVGKLVVPA